MENSVNILKQLKIIKWLVILVAAGILTGAGSIAVFAYTATKLAESSLSNGSCEENFRDRVSSLLDEGKLEEAINLSNNRIKTHPNDEDAFWHRGVSYYLQSKWQLAIEDFNKVEELAPSWKERYVEPYRTAAQSKMKP